MRWWEQRTVPASQWAPTNLAERHLGLTTLFCLVWAGIWAVNLGMTGAYVLAVPLLARAIALDAHYRVLPHLYTWPFLGLGLLWGGGFAVLAVGLLLISGGLWLVIWRLGTGRWAQLGGGDIWLILGLAAWLPIGAFGGVILLSLLFMIPSKILVKEKESPPYGPALFASTVVWGMLGWVF